MTRRDGWKARGWKGDMNRREFIEVVSASAISAAMPSFAEERHTIPHWRGDLVSAIDIAGRVIRK